MIPERIQPFFKTTFQKTDNGNSIVEGLLNCCAAHEFEVFVVGKIKRGIFSKMHIIPENNQIVLKVRCKKCGRVISVFDSNCDGYEKCGINSPTQALAQPINCMKCHNGCFSVDVKYEYCDIHELEEREIEKIDNAFTWVWITIKCNKCGAIYKNFIDYETA